MEKLDKIIDELKTLEYKGKGHILGDIIVFKQSLLNSIEKHRVEAEKRAIETQQYKIDEYAERLNKFKKIANKERFNNHLEKLKAIYEKIEESPEFKEKMIKEIDILLKEL